MRKLCTLFFVLVSINYAIANDGSFYASGGTLIPLKETTIRLKKEVLSLERKYDWMQVDIYFEFENPGPAKDLLVGFVTPPASGDITEADADHPQIGDFMVMVGNRLLPFKIARLEQSGFKVNEKLADGQDFVYYFTVHFETGTTIVRHSYEYRKGASVEANAEFYYRLTTGTSWANGAIDDFELNINMGDDSYFSVPKNFDTKSNANWTIVGVGRLSLPMSRPFLESTNMRMAYLRKGKLQLRATAFKPENDLALTQWNIFNEVFFWTDKKQENDFTDLIQMIWEDSAASVIRRLSDNQLRLYRNLHYARMGYDFKDANLKKAFEKYIWYIPDPALKPEKATEYYLSKNTQQLIQDEEKKRKLVWSDSK
jgi:hypothetical protein